MAVLDGNHPYAGWTLRFEIQVMRVELVEEGDIAESDIFIPDFLKVANDSVKEEAEDRLEVDEARAKIAEQLDKVDEAKPQNAMAPGFHVACAEERGLIAFFFSDRRIGMPELPEVETVRRYLDTKLPGDRITAVTVDPSPSHQEPDGRRLQTHSHGPGIPGR